MGVPMLNANNTRRGHDGGWGGQACTNDRPINVLYHNILKCQVSFSVHQSKCKKHMLISLRGGLLGGLCELKYRTTSTISLVTAATKTGGFRQQRSRPRLRRLRRLRPNWG